VIVTLEKSRDFSKGITVLFIDVFEFKSNSLPDDASEDDEEGEVESAPRPRAKRKAGKQEKERKGDISKRTI